jgi:transposase
MEADFPVHLANTGAIKQYEGLKHGDDITDARFLAHLLRLGILPEGYIYPREERPVRDLLRKRLQMVHQGVTHLLSLQGQITRYTGRCLSGNEVKGLQAEQIDELIKTPEAVLAAQTNWLMFRALSDVSETLEKAALQRARHKPELKWLQTVSGIGKVLGLTILLETGDIRRFPRVGDYASYARCVKSERFSNGKRKGSGNRKNGNKYLGWAFVEAAHFAIRWEPKIRAYHQRKLAKAAHPMVALKAVANKLVRACYYVLLRQEPFDVNRAFSG